MDGTNVKDFELMLLLYLLLPYVIIFLIFLIFFIFNMIIMRKCKSAVFRLVIKLDFVISIMFNKNHMTLPFESSQ